MLLLLLLLVAGVSVARLPERQRVSSVISISIFFLLCIFLCFFRVTVATVASESELKMEMELEATLAVVIVQKNYYDNAGNK